jgi:hypothetical protein
MPVRVFRQERPATGTGLPHFVDRTADAGLAGSEGWWNTIAVADVNGDGRPDLVLGNVGLNGFVKATPQEPARLYVGDFQHNGTLEPILTSYRHGVSYPLAGRDEILQLVPSLGSKFPTYASFGASRVEDIFPAADLERATVLEAHTFATSVALNLGHGRFALRALPLEAQLAPVNAVIARDLDGDGKTDLLLAGNFYGVPPIEGRYDAGDGVLLRGLGDGRFEAVDPARTGVVLDGQVRHMRLLGGADGAERIVVARNDDRLQIVRVGAPRTSTLALGRRAH